MIGVSREDSENESVLKEDSENVIYRAQMRKNVIEMVWEDPRPTNMGPHEGQRVSDRATGAHAPVAKILRQHPGRWARIFADGTRDQLSGYSTLINRGKFMAYTPAGHYQAVIRMNGLGLFDLYVRFVGPFVDVEYPLELIPHPPKWGKDA